MGTVVLLLGGRILAKSREGATDFHHFQKHLVVGVALGTSTRSHQLRPAHGQRQISKWYKLVTFRKYVSNTNNTNCNIANVLQISSEKSCHHFQLSVLSELKVNQKHSLSLCQKVTSFRKARSRCGHLENNSTSSTRIPPCLEKHLISGQLKDGRSSTPNVQGKAVLLAGQWDF